jgi:ADP-heptose:LPS heptosyltransferase
VALHQGCKPDWRRKKWHGFNELAARLPHVVVRGTAAHLDNRQAYLGKDFAWPAYAHSFVGELDLGDTTALLSGCAALVSNDSGLMPIGVALGFLTTMCVGCPDCLAGSSSTCKTIRT